MAREATFPSPSREKCSGWPRACKAAEVRARESWEILNKPREDTGVGSARLPPSLPRALLAAGLLMSLEATSNTQMVDLRPQGLAHDW